MMKSDFGVPLLLLGLVAGATSSCVRSEFENVNRDCPSEGRLREVDEHFRAIGLDPLNTDFFIGTCRQSRAFTAGHLFVIKAQTAEQRMTALQLLVSEYKYDKVAKMSCGGGNLMVIAYPTRETLSVFRGEELREPSAL